MIIAENSYNVYLYQHNDNLILKIFNNNIIHEEVVDTNHKNITYCQLDINFNEITIYYKTDNSVVIKRYSFEENMIVNIYFSDNEFDSLLSKSTNIIRDSLGNNYFGIIYEKEQFIYNLIIYKITQLNNIIIFNEIELTELNDIELHIDNKLFIFINSNKYYEIDLDTNEIEQKYLNMKIISNGKKLENNYFIKNNSLPVIFNYNNLYTIGYELKNNNYEINIYKDGEDISEIVSYENEYEIFEKFRIYQFEIYENKLIVSYSKRYNEVSIENNLKSFIIIDLETKNTVYNSLKYSLLMIDSFNNNILLFDVRDKRIL